METERAWHAAAIKQQRGPTVYEEHVSMGAAVSGSEWLCVLVCVDLCHNVCVVYQYQPIPKKLWMLTVTSRAPVTAETCGMRPHSCRREVAIGVVG